MKNLIKFIQPVLFTILALSFISNSAYGQSQKTITELRMQIARTDGDTERAALYLKLATNYLIKPGELAKDLDSARFLNSSALSLSRELGLITLEAQALLLNARIQLEAGERDKARKSIMQALTFSKKFNLVNEQGKCYETQVDLYDNENPGIERKLQLLGIAVSLYHQSGEKANEANALKRLGDYLHMRGRNTEALKTIQRSLAIYNTIHFTDLQEIYNLLGKIQASLGNYNLSVKYGLLSVKIAEKVGDHSLLLSSTYNHIGQTYYMLKDDDKAAFYWEKAAQTAEKFNDAGYMQIILTNLATLSIRQHKYQKALNLLARIEKRYPPTDVYMNLRLPYIYFNTYMKMGRFDKLKPYYDKLRMYERTLPADDANQIYLLESIVTYLINIKDIKQAYIFLQKEGTLLSAGDNKLMLSRHEYKYFKADSIAGRLKSAMDHYIHFKSLSDSVFNAEKSNQINTLQIQFETEQKDRNIALLTQKNSLQADTIKKDRLINLSISGALTLFLLLLISGAFAYRAKQKSHAQLRRKQDEINEQYDVLKQVVNEKEWLLREIHHRVKNNLQIVISLLNSQSAYLEDQDAMEAIQSSQHRMHAMSLIHQKLYQSDNLATINLKWYTQELITYMRDCFDIDSRIRFLIEAEELLLDVAQAVPVGLILNEAVTNSIKYAFTDGRFGTISVNIDHTNDGFCFIAIKDNGIGLPEDFDIEGLNSLGINLMRGLAEQLEGLFEITSENGSLINVSFPVKRQYINIATVEVEAA